MAFTKYRRRKKYFLPSFLSGITFTALDTVRPWPIVTDDVEGL
jgi:hypothetical protein